MQPTHFLPIAFCPTPVAATPVAPQEPQSTPDAPSGGATPTAPTGTVQVDPNAPKPQQPQSPCANDSIVWMMPLFLVLMYFMMIRPEQKRRKEQQALLSSIKQGDRVVTISGMHGVISRLTDKTVTLRLDTGEATFDRSAIARIERGDTPQKAT